MSKILALIRKASLTSGHYQELDLYDMDRNPIEFPAAPPAVEGVDRVILNRSYGSPTLSAGADHRFAKMRSFWDAPDAMPSWLSKDGGGIVTLAENGKYTIDFRAQGKLSTVGGSGTEYEVGIALVPNALPADAIFETAIATQWLPPGYDLMSRRFGLSVHTAVDVSSPPISFGAWVYFSVMGPDPSFSGVLDLEVPYVQEIDATDHTIFGQTPLNRSGNPVQLDVVRLGNAPSEVIGV